jgi:C1A family cysteine protease
MSEPTRHKKAYYGWVPDLPDTRDHLYAAPAPTLADLPASVDLTDGCPKTVYDQGRIGSCTANAIAAAFEFDLLKQHLTDFMPSRLFIYYNERAIEGTVGSDSGAMIRDGIKSVATQGVCTELEWPYDDTSAGPDGSWPAGARPAQKPGAQCYTDAAENRATSYQRVVRDLDQMKGCLAAGYPFVFGFSVYDSFESSQVARTGTVPMPGTDETLLGGHAVLAVGYDDAEERFRVRNSWGSGWGQEGYFTMPYEYLTTRSLASDFWTIRVVTEGEDD